MGRNTYNYEVKKMNVFERFMELRFPDLNDPLYMEIWKYRFEKGIYYAQNYMDKGSRECLKQVLTEWIRELDKY